MAYKADRSQFRIPEEPKLSSGRINPEERYLPSVCDAREPQACYSNFSSVAAFASENCLGSQGVLMLYRKLGKSGVEVSALGFGCMRLPMVNSTRGADIFDPNKPIDEEVATKMICHAIETGVNYFDTAYGYHSGKSELFLGKALKSYHARVMMATKLPTWLVKDTSDFYRIFNEQLQKLDTECIDVYLLHGLNQTNWKRMKELDVFKFLDNILSEGRIRFAGFSFHDDVRIFKEIVDGYGWTLCQIQYNYFDENYQAGKEGLQYAAAKGLGVVVMEPLRGGKLTDKIPPEVQAIWDVAETRRTPAEWALRWVWNHAEVSTVLSGMNTMAQLIENTSIANQAKPNSLSTGELASIQQAREIYRKMLKVDCTGCGYCMPCPQGINIPVILSLYNDTFMFKDPEMNVILYSRMFTPGQQASNCAECGECEEQCPQKIRIMDELKNAHRRLTS